MFYYSRTSCFIQKNGESINYDSEVFMPHDTTSFISEMYLMADDRKMEKLLTQGDDDFFFCYSDTFRFRVRRILKNTERPTCSRR